VAFKNSTVNEVHVKIKQKRILGVEDVKTLLAILVAQMIKLEPLQNLQPDSKTRLFVL
jgi:hypothetical protein